MREKLVLPHIVLNNPGHIITLCESWDFQLFNSLCIEYGTIGIQCASDKPDRSPPVAVFLKTPYGMLEVLHHWDESKQTKSKTDGWVLHGAIISCVFGPRSHNIDPGTRQRVERRHYGEPIEHYALVEEDRICTHGVRTVETPAGKLDRVESYEEISDGSYFSVRGFPTTYVQRMGLSEYSVLCIHINSWSFHHSIQRVRETLRSIFSKALMRMVDFICGDFNLFANRQFYRDVGGSMLGGIVVEVLEDAIRAMNQQLKHQYRVTFNISSSTRPQDVFDAVFANRNANMDCMLCISLFFNKQDFEVPRPNVLTDQFTISHDYLHSVSERPRQLSNYDLCLGLFDCDWHLPLYAAYPHTRSRTNAHAALKHRMFAINVSEAGLLDRAKERAKVDNPTVTIKNGPTNNGTKIRVFKRIDMIIPQADTTATDLDPMLPMDHLHHLHEHHSGKHQDGYHGSVDGDNRRNG